MYTNEYNFDLPEYSIARYPKNNRDKSQLLVLNPETKTIKHHIFTNIVDFLHPGDLLILNDTKVIPAKLTGKKSTGGSIQALFDHALDTHTACVQIKSNKALKKGDIIEFSPVGQGEILGRKEHLYTMRSTLPIEELLQKSGSMPLPPYLKRETEAIDHERYQTVFANHPGAIAAPTAGLHFTHPLLTLLKEKGVNIEMLTLHVGTGTFQPIYTNDLSKHTLHYERITLSPKLCQTWQDTRSQGKRVIAVGTTTVRALESAYCNGQLEPGSKETNLFIKPGYQCKTIDGLITNFHLPKSSLLLLVSALAGWALIKEAYKEAIQNNYRFYSYGDAMLILPIKR